MKKKLLIETSCVPVALRETTPTHRSHFEETASDGTLWTSVYIRGEYIRRWIKGYISLAFDVEHFGSLEVALAFLEEQFAIRKIKIGVHALRMLFQEKGEIHNTRSAAIELGRMAVLKLKKFDRTFVQRINNSCDCQIGGKRLVVDHNKFFESLRTFIQSVDNVPNCPVNGYLALANENGRARKLVADKDAGETKSGVKLREFAADGVTIDCRRCAQIGDAIIALEQPKPWELVHIDNDFDFLCRVTDPAL